jgi:hypothetical protein
MEHKCDRSWERGAGFYAGAIGTIEYLKEDKMWVAHCDEYGTEIKYCPFCGMNLALLNWTEKEIDAKNNVGIAIGIVSKDL